LERVGLGKLFRERLIQRIKDAGGFQEGMRPGSQLTSLRNAHGLSTAQCAKAAGVSEADYKRFELGTLALDDQTLQKLADVLFVNVETLRYVRDSEPAPMMSQKAEVSICLSKASSMNSLDEAL
jgi:transcriptional regulator with XRE-family HTH domain